MNRFEISRLNRRIFSGGLLSCGKSGEHSITMAVCLKCRCELTELDFNSGRCSNCHAVLATIKSVTAPSDTDPTTDDDTLVNERSTDVDDAPSTANETKINATVELDAELSDELASSNSVAK